MNPLPTFEAPRDWLLASAAVMVAAPLVGGGLAALGMASRAPRRLAIMTAGLALIASLTMVAAWHLSDRTPVGFGETLGDGRFVFIDGLTVALLPYVAVVSMAILLVAPRRAAGSWPWR